MGNATIGDSIPVFGRLGTGCFSLVSAGSLRVECGHGRLARVVVHGFPYHVGHRGNRTGMTKTEGGVSKGTTYTYDAGEQLTRFIYSEGGTAQYTKTYGCDAAGQTTRVTKAGGGLTTEVKTYEWDAMGRMTKAEVSAGSTTTYDYNPSGDRVKRVEGGRDETVVLRRPQHRDGAIVRFSAGTEMSVTLLFRTRARRPRPLPQQVSLKRGKKK